jgi:hypothetical protein
LQRHDLCDAHGRLGSIGLSLPRTGGSLMIESPSQMLILFENDSWVSYPQPVHCIHRCCQRFTAPPPRLASLAP